MNAVVSVNKETKKRLEKALEGLTDEEYLIVCAYAQGIAQRRRCAKAKMRKEAKEKE